MMEAAHKALVSPAPTRLGAGLERLTHRVTKRSRS
ncbi:hypothetical protein ACVIWV_001395 [Bradyrhizobium diazoefficiens]|nr:hypothetical protein [Bradyrhizobium japonicum]